VNPKEPKRFTSGARQMGPGFTESRGWQLSVCVLCGSPVWPSPPVVGPLWGPPLCVGPLCGSPVRVPCVGPLCGSPLCGSPVWVPCVGPLSRCVMWHLLAWCLPLVHTLPLSNEYRSRDCPRRVIRLVVVQCGAHILRLAVGDNRALRKLMP